MKIQNSLLLITFLLISQHISATILSNDFFGISGQPLPFASNQGSLNFQQPNPQAPQNQQSNPQPTQQIFPFPIGQQQNQQNLQFNNQNLLQQQSQNQEGPNQNQNGINSNQNGSPNLLNPINSENQNNQGQHTIEDCDLQFKNEVLIFDSNRQELCKQPRHWNGNKCVCPNNGVFLSGKCFAEVPKEGTRNIFSLRFINRNFDGSQNNPRYPQYGARGNPLLRLTDPNYEDGRSEPLKQIPSPRQVSNIIGVLKGTMRNLNMYNHMFISWSQLIGNDITFTPTEANEHLNIPVPRCDKAFDKFCTGKQQLNFARSIYQIKRRIRTHINTVSSWLDASNIYGSDQKTADSLRQFRGGKLRVSQDNFLPKAQNGEFISGDRRVNQNVLLTVLHTIFVRQHNRICQNVTSRNSALTDEEVYQIARNYVIGLIQHVTFDQWLPGMFGRMTFNKFIGNYKFDPEANPAIFTEFQVAGLRVFDSFIGNNVVRMHPNQARQIAVLKYKDILENPQLLNRTSISEYISGATRGMIKTKTLELIDDLRESFIFSQSPKQNTDLYSINLQRGRDHGVGSLKDVREALRLHSANISKIFGNQPKTDCLQGLYQDPDNIDLWLALIGEQPEAMTALGEIGNKLWILQMNKIRNGDSLWYENVYPEDVIKEIKATSLRQIFERNSEARGLPRNPFMMTMGWRD